MDLSEFTVGSTAVRLFTRASAGVDCVVTALRHCVLNSAEGSTLGAGFISVVCRWWAHYQVYGHKCNSTGSLNGSLGEL